MAERGTWGSIKKRGLLSTSAVLDLHKVTGSARRKLEAEHRPDKVAIGLTGTIVLRDQKPMPPDRLAKALQDGISPTEWYRLLNGKVFMWAEEKRLHGLLKARHYRALEHDVLVVDAGSLLRVHAPAIWLCPMNSGNTFPMPHLRGRDTFRRIKDYPVGKRGQPKKKVVEVVVDYSIPDIADHVIEVRVMRGDSTLSVKTL
jgi:hypothetical protein